MSSIRSQATPLALAGGAIRAAGFVMRLMFARLMGAEALGVMELAQSVGMLALTPVTAGTPAAVSRLTACRPDCDKPQVLRAALSLAERTAWLLMPLLVLLSPLMTWLLGDERVLPALLALTPGILLLGKCAVYCGYCYGLEQAGRAAALECVEQGTRFALSAVLLVCFRHYGTALVAAMPHLAETCAAVVVLLLFRQAFPLRHFHDAPSAALCKQLTRLALPTVASRLVVTGMRTVNAVLLPVCLQKSGLSTSAAVAQFGLMNGMALPLTMLPGIITGAISMVGAPAMAKREGNIQAVRRLALRLIGAGLAAGIGGGILLSVGADVIANGLYHQSALASLLRVLSPMALLFGLHQVLYGMVMGLGLQRKALTGTICGAALTLVLTALLTPSPQLRLYGAAIALMAGQAVNLVWCAAVLMRSMQEKLLPN